MPLAVVPTAIPESDQTSNPSTRKDQGKDLGLSTWTPGQWKMGGGSVWGWVSYDPELNLLYYGTGNPGVWNADMRPGDNKWSITIWARDPETGNAKWAYQVVPHDAWDYDEIMENILIDMPWQGRMRKLLLHPGRTGFMFVLDRETGEVLSAEKYEPVNWASSYDLKPAFPISIPKNAHTSAITPLTFAPRPPAERIHSLRVLPAHRITLHSRAQHLHGL